MRLEHLRLEACNRAAALSQLCGSLAQTDSDKLQSTGRRSSQDEVGTPGGMGGGAWGHLAELLGRTSVEVQPMDWRIADSKLLEVESMAEWQARVLWAGGVQSPLMLSRMVPARVGVLLGTHHKQSAAVCDVLYGCVLTDSV